MKPEELKVQYIKLRAESRSFSYIAKELQISKSTCSSWEQELKEKIQELKQDKLEELYTSYYMTKEARIKKLGEALAKIDTALEKVDLTEASPEKLLDYKLKYQQALKEEYTNLNGAYHFTGQVNPKEIVTALADLLNRIRSGDITPEQAGKESLVIANLLKAFDIVELQAKIDTLESVVGSR